MGRGYNHWSFCTCGWCVNYGGYSRPLIKFNWKSDLIKETRDNQRLSKLREYFSFTCPNAICPNCHSQVYYYQNSYGSKVFFDELGKPWPKHNCSSDFNINVIPDAIDTTNPEAVFIRKTYSTDYFPVEVISKYRLIDDYYVIEISKMGTEIGKFVIKNPPYYLGLTFIEKSSGKIFLSGYESEEYMLECHNYESFFKENDHLFPYTVGDEIEILVDSKNEIGLRIEIFIHKPYKGMTDFIYKGYIYKGNLSSNSREILKKIGHVRIKAKSQFNRDNEVIFYEIT